MARSLIIEDVVRTQAERPDESLAFGLGVNVVVGAPNTGKTAWLKMINSVLSNDDSMEVAIGEGLANKYDSVTVAIRIDGAQHTLQRRWKEAGARGKVFFDNQAMSPDELSEELMKRLDIPVLHYPQGNPFGSRTWPELSWRSLFRHIYRRQGFWSDLADGQPETDQHACILQFVGLARHLYSNEYGSLVQKEKQILMLQARKDQFVEMLQEVSKEILDEPEISVALTPESLETAIQQVENRIKEISTQREGTLRSLRAHADVMEGKQSSIYQKVSEELALLKSQEISRRQQQRSTEDRLTEIEQYKETLERELARLQRAQVAGGLLAGLKVTHCPACDQEIQRKDEDSGTCYVCGQTMPEGSGTGGEGRLSFEVKQLEGELKEADELLRALLTERDAVGAQRGRASERILQLEVSLKTTRTAAAQILPPELSLYDQEAGRLQERIRQLQRVSATLSRREQINEEIHGIQEEIVKLESQVADQAKNLNFEQASDELGDGMNTYLNAIVVRNPRSWTLAAPVKFRLSERNFKVLVGNENWKAKLGGTLTLYFVMAYQYSLMRLCTKSNANFPGLLLLDFPAQLEDGTAIADKENFVLEPFVKLCKQIGSAGGQVIAMGSAFENLNVANRLELTEIWQ